MNPFSKHRLIRSALTLALLVSLPLASIAQWPYGTPTTPDAQRNALRSLQAQVDWFQNATRTGPSYGAGGYDNVWQTFQSVRDSYNTLKQTLSPRQVNAGANELAELDAGLDILQEAFTYYNEDVAAGRNINSAIRDMCQVMRQGADLWKRQLNKTCGQLRVGWG